MLPELEPYFAKYYDRWLNYSQYICTRLGIRREAYDIMADVLVEFCCKSDDALADFLFHERRGERKLFQFVRRGILFRAIGFIRQKRMVFCDIEKHTFHLSVPGDDDLKTEISNEMREAEAMFRDDSLMIPVATSAKQIGFPKISIVGYLDTRHAQGKGRLNVVYRTAINMSGKRIKQIARASRSAAIAAVIQYQMHV